MIEGLSVHEKRVYERFRRAFVNMPLDFHTDAVLDDNNELVGFQTEAIVAPEDEAEAKRARMDVRALCQEMEQDDTDLSLSRGQMDVLSMAALCDVAELTMARELSLDGRNFND